MTIYRCEVATLVSGNSGEAEILRTPLGRRPSRLSGGGAAVVNVNPAESLTSHAECTVLEAVQILLAGIWLFILGDFSVILKF